MTVAQRGRYSAALGLAEMGDEDGQHDALQRLPRFAGTTGWGPSLGLQASRRAHAVRQTDGADGRAAMPATDVGEGEGDAVAVVVPLIGNQSLSFRKCFSNRCQLSHATANVTVVPSKQCRI